MFESFKMFVLAFIYLLAVVSGRTENDQPVIVEINRIDPVDVLCDELSYEEASYGRNNSEEIHPAKFSVLSPPYERRSPEGEVSYHYNCTAGILNEPNVEHISCAGAGFKHWNSENDYYLKLRCREAGSGLIISYMDIYFVAESANANCYIAAGGIGYDYIEVILHVSNSSNLVYLANFFTP